MPVDGIDGDPRTLAGHSLRTFRNGDRKGEHDGVIAICECGEECVECISTDFARHDHEKHQKAEED